MERYKNVLEMTEKTLRFLPNVLAALIAGYESLSELTYIRARNSYEKSQCYEYLRGSSSICRRIQIPSSLGLYESTSCRKFPFLLLHKSFARDGTVCGGV